MTELNPQEAPQGMLAAGAPGASEIPHNLRQTSSEDMIQQPLNSLGILADQSQSAIEDDDYDVATSVGASINESMLMLPETLATGLSNSQKTADLGQTEASEAEFEKKMRNRPMQAVAQNIHRNPYAYIAGALGLGLILTKRRGFGRGHSI